MIDATSSALGLQDCPNWRYLLREFDALYRAGSSGGSPMIRSHRKRVRDRLSNEVKSNPLILERPATSLPVTAHLARALGMGERGVLQGMTLANTAYSVNIKERYDFSCAIFDQNGDLVAKPASPEEIGRQRVIQKAEHNAPPSSFLTLKSVTYLKIIRSKPELCARF